MEKMELILSVNPQNGTRSLLWIHEQDVLRPYPLSKRHRDSAWIISSWLFLIRRISRENNKFFLPACAQWST